MAKQILLFFLLAGIMLTTGCTSFWQTGQPYGQRDGASGSLVDYLYPKDSPPPQEVRAVPQLNLPLRVGIAFVPSRYAPYSALSEATKNDLLEGLSGSFIERDYIDHIEIIPDTYLRSSSGFDGMQQVARLYGVDVMALVSYDQVSTSEDRKSSLLYWSIIGAYVVKGTENEVQTFVDTAVFDVGTRNLLFRAPGTDHMKLRSTAIEANESVRKSRNASFSNAIDNMTANLSQELDEFEIRLQENPSAAEVTWKKGSGGSGSYSFLTLVLLSLLWVQGRRKTTLVAS